MREAIEVLSIFGFIVAVLLAVAGLITLLVGAIRSHQRCTSIGIWLTIIGVVLTFACFRLDTR